MNTRLLPVLAAACLPCLLVACGGQQPAPQSPAPAAAAAAATPDAPVPEPIATAMGRVRSMLESVDDAKIKEAFSPDFLASVPPSQVTQVFTEAHKSVGACSGQQPLAIKGTEAHFRITCEHGQLDAKLVVQDKSPFMIDGLLIRPAN